MKSLMHIAIILLALLSLTSVAMAQKPILPPAGPGTPRVIVAEFVTANCPFCNQVAPVVDRLAQQGVPIVRVRADEPDGNRQFKALFPEPKNQTVPRFVVLTQAGDGSGQWLAGDSKQTANEADLRVFLRSNNLIQR